ncbi:MAG: zinc-binding dehydrogenase [Halosimplex sp.]
MRTNDTVVFADANEVTVEERPVPEPGAGQVLVEAERSLISTGTELTQLSGDVPEGSVWDQISNYPIDTPGYCTTGEIVEVGDGVDESVVGDRVATWKHHARYTVADYDAVEPVPDGVSAEEAAFTPIVQIVMNGVRHGDIDWGESVGIYGLGLLGQLATRFVRMAGTRPVYALDLAEERIEYLPEDSAIEVVNPAEDDPRERVESTGHGRLADVVFEVTGNPDVITQEFDILREEGRLVMLSSPKGETAFDFHDYCNRGSYEIVGVTPTDRRVVVGVAVTALPEQRDAVDVRAFERVAERLGVEIDADLALVSGRVEIEVDVRLAEDVARPGGGVAGHADPRPTARSGVAPEPPRSPPTRPNASIATLLSRNGIPERVANPRA